MRSFFKTMTIALICMLSLTQCCKNKLSNDTYFYMDSVTDLDPLKLYIDGEYMGYLPYIKTGGNYDNYESIQEHGLHATIKSSSFKAEVRNGEGKTIMYAVIKRDVRSARIADCSGAMELTQTPDFVLISFSDPAKNQE